MKHPSNSPGLLNMGLRGLLLLASATFGATTPAELPPIRLGSKPADAAPERRPRPQPPVPVDAKEIPFLELAPEPVLTDFQKMAIEYGETQTVDLTLDAVLTAAVDATGLDDFGPDDFRERLDLWVREPDEDSDRLGLGRMVLFGNVVRYASNRLRIVDLLKQHPEIRDVEIGGAALRIGLARV